MNRNEAYETMIRGEKIRNEKWIDGVHAFYRDGKFIFCKDGYETSMGTCMDWGNNYEIYQEPKPVRTLVAYEYKDTGELSFYIDRKVNYADYRKLSDSELKELIKGVIGE
jgi:hypothetical protein